MKEHKHEWHQPKGSEDIICKECKEPEPVFYNKEYTLIIEAKMQVIYGTPEERELAQRFLNCMTNLNSCLKPFDYSPIKKLC